MTAGLEELMQLLHELDSRDVTPRLADGERALLEEASRRWPFFAAPQRILALQPDAPEELKARVALMELGHRSLETSLTGGEWDNFYPAPAPPAASVDTDAAITAFLETYGGKDATEDAILEKLIFNPTPDYGELLAREEQESLPAMPTATMQEGEPTQEELIDSFILRHHPAASRAHDKAGEEGTEAAQARIHASQPEKTDALEDTLLSESLARIFIRQGRYERAYEIINGLNLKFPEKSIYFADQLRFLQKLIINQRAKARNN